MIKCLHLAFGLHEVENDQISKNRYTGTYDHILTIELYFIKCRSIEQFYIQPNNALYHTHEEKGQEDEIYNDGDPEF